MYHGLLEPLLRHELLLDHEGLAHLHERVPHPHLGRDQSVNPDDVNAQVKQDVDNDGGFVLDPLGEGQAKEDLQDGGITHADEKGAVERQRHHCVQQQQDGQVQSV